MWCYIQQNVALRSQGDIKWLNLTVGCKWEQPRCTLASLIYFQLNYPLHVTYLLTPLSRVLEKLTGLQLAKKFPTFYGTRRFITAFKSAHYLSLTWASSIQSIPPPPTSWRSILILSSYLQLGLPNGLFSFCFPTKTLYTPLAFPVRATCPTHLQDLYPLDVSNR
jgi:hypothetical protein